jgi:transposase-like protein
MSVPAIYIDSVLNLYYSGMRINEIRDNMQLRYGYSPSAALMHLWIDKYTDIAHKTMSNYRPRVGDTWIAGEMITRLGNKKYWMYEIVDDKTSYILASLITLRSPGIIKALIEGASGISRRIPKMVLVYTPRANFNTLEKGSGYAFEHVPVEEFAIRHRIGILGNINIYRTRNVRFFRTLKTANKFYRGLAINYNCFDPVGNFNGKIPAELTQINYPYRSWQDLIEKVGRRAWSAPN